MLGHGNHSNGFLLLIVNLLPNYQSPNQSIYNSALKGAEKVHQLAHVLWFYLNLSLWFIQQRDSLCHWTNKDKF